MSRSRGWCFTLNNYTEAEETALLTLDIKYIVIGREVGEKGTPHLQGYIEFVNQRNLAQVKKYNEKAHWETRKGTPSEAANYCKKTENSKKKGLCLSINQVDVRTCK